MILKSILGKLGLYTIYRVPLKNNMMVTLKKDKFEKLNKQCIIYKCKCLDFDVVHIGQQVGHFR